MAVIGFVQHFPLQERLERELVTAAAREGVGLRLEPGQWNLPLGTTLNLREVTYPTRDPVWRVRLPGAIHVHGDLPSLIFGDERRGTVTGLDGALRASAVSRGESLDVAIAIRDLDPAIVEGPHSAFASFAGELSLDLNGTVPSVSRNTAFLTGTASLDGSVTVPTIIGPPLELQDVTIRFDLEIRRQNLSIRTLEVRSSLGEADISGRFSLNPRGSGGLRVRAEVAPGFFAEREDLRGFAEPYLQGDSTVVLRVSQRSGRWSVGR